MRLPDLLPKELHFVKEAPSDEALFTLLSQQPPKLIDFFVSATEDETWCQAHSAFMLHAIHWLTENFFQGRLDPTKPVRALQRHFHAAIVPNDVKVVVGGHEYPMNRLLLAHASETFFYRLTAGDLSLTIPEDHFVHYKEFIETGKTSQLWRMDLNELLRMQKESKILVGFDNQIADTIKRYLNRDNVLDLLQLALDERWESLKNHCIDSLGPVLKKGGPGLHFVYTPDENDLFLKLAPRITHLSCSGELPSLKKCSKLIALDLSHSTTPYTGSVEGLKELNLSMCSWLNEQTIKPLISPITTLKLRGNHQLSFTFWSQPLLLYPPRIFGSLPMRANRG